MNVAEQYIADVVDGKIVTSKWVRLQCERHLEDLETGHERGLVFDRDAAEHILEFFPLYLVHTEGEFCDKPFDLMAFQQAKFWILYGWKWEATGFRRFRYAYNEIGRGNGKSAEASGLCIYELKFRGEAGAHVYSASTDKKTAKLVFDTAKLMVQKSAWLQARIGTYKDNLNVPGTASKFEPCASEDSNLMGLRPSFVALDELHAHASSAVWDVFDSAFGKRRDPLMYAITNSGFDRNSVCWSKREYSTKVLQGIIPDDTWFSWICGLDVDEAKGEKDEWEDESNWIKANPALGTIVRIEELRSAAEKAKNDPSTLNAFLRFRLSMWTTSHSTWMPMDKWDACHHFIDVNRLRGRRCIGAMDLSTTTDIAAVVLLFDPVEDDPHWYVLPFFFLPKDNIEKRVKRDRVPYDRWANDGLFTLTEGNVIDYAAIEKKVLELRGTYDMIELAFDRWNSSDIVTRLTDEGLTMVKFGQGFAEMSAPTKRVMELVLTGDLAHGNNPILRWMASNVVARMDPAGNIKPDKEKSREKIDGIVALDMALGRLMVAPKTQYTSPEVSWL